MHRRSLNNHKRNESIKKLLVCVGVSARTKSTPFYVFCLISHCDLNQLSGHFRCEQQFDEYDRLSCCAEELFQLQLVKYYMQQLANGLVTFKLSVTKW